MSSDVKRMWSAHPLLFAVFPVLFLFAHNVDQVTAGDAYRPMLIVLCATTVVWTIAYLVMRNATKSALCASLVVVMFFFFRTAHDGLNTALSVIGVPEVRIRYLTLFWIASLFYLCYRIMKSQGSFRLLNTMLNRVAILLIAFQIGDIYMNRPAGAYADSEIGNDTTRMISDSIERRPNIYLITLDAYARADILHDYFEYDNTPFLDSLRSRGFFVADSSTSNYRASNMSLASELNMDYIHDEVDIDPEKPSENPSAAYLIQHSRVVRLLKDYGYDFVAFSTGYSNTEVRNADIYLSNPWAPTEFENMLLNMTAFPPLFRMVGWDSQFTTHRDRILFTLGKLRELAQSKKPLFVFAHILTPHAPFIFGRNGELVNTERPWGFCDANNFVELYGSKAYVEGYRNQLHHLNSLVLSAVDKVLENSELPPIIIIQGDHGSRLRVNLDDQAKTDLVETFANLCAIHLPDSTQRIPDDVSLVNVFAYALNSCFHTNFPIRPDECFYYPLSDSTDLANVTAQARRFQETPH